MNYDKFLVNRKSTLNLFIKRIKLYYYILDAYILYYLKSYLHRYLHRKVNYEDY